MGDTTDISWADATFNPWIGCTKVSVGPQGACEGCYAEHLMDTRRHVAQWGNHARVRTAASNWAKPIRWNKDAAKSGKPHFVFCASLADVFDNQVDPEWCRDLFALIRATPALTWLLLTKRPQNIVKLYNEVAGDRPSGPQNAATLRYATWPRNAAIGCSVVTQAEADRDLPVLLMAKRVLRPAFAFVSMEPLMEAVDLQNIHLADGRQMQALRGSIWRGSYWTEDCAALDWVITGGETDQGKHRARPIHPDWVRSLRDQCRAAGVPFHFKQWGNWYPMSEDGEFRPIHTNAKEAGRLFEGALHDARPRVGA